MKLRMVAAPLILLPALFRGRKASNRMYAEDYDKRAPTYDTAKGRSEMAAVSERLLERAETPGCRRVLDLACGTGHVTALLAERFPGIAIDAVDISQAMLKEARRKMGELANVSFRQTSMEDFLKGCPVGQYGLITCMWGIGYAHPRRVLQLIARALANNGSVAVAVNTRQSLMEVQELYARILLRHPFYLKGVPCIGFPRSQKQFMRWVHRAGLAPEFVNESDLLIEFKSGTEFVKWLRDAGQAAGLEASIRPDCREKVFREIEGLLRNSPFRVTHRFIEFIGQRK